MITTSVIFFTGQIKIKLCKGLPQFDSQYKSQVKRSQWIAKKQTTLQVKGT